MFFTNESELSCWNRAVMAVISGTRCDADLSQKDLARRLHVTRNTIANIETGRRVVGATELPIIALALGISPEVLFKRIVLWYITLSPPVTAVMMAEMDSIA
jgi:DNA-binding XRE family transcriptional regulator